MIEVFETGVVARILVLVLTGLNIWHVQTQAFLNEIQIFDSVNTSQNFKVDDVLLAIKHFQVGFGFLADAGVNKKTVLRVLVFEGA